jgi:hypothetical protein
MWLCGGLFILFGLPLVILEDKRKGLLFAGLSSLALGSFGLAMAGDGVVKGEVKLHSSVIRRSNQPFLFWVVTALIAAAGVGTIVTAVLVFFFKMR